MTAITLRPPWGMLIFRGRKRLETRAHARFARLVGRRVAIHQGATPDRDAWRALVETGHNMIQSLLSETPAESPRGVVLGTVLVAAHRPMVPEDSTLAMVPYRAGLYVLELTDIRPLAQPVPARGRQGIWEWIGDDA